MKKYEVTHQYPNGEYDSVYFNDPKKAVEHAEDILKDVDKTNPLGFVSVAECEFNDGEIEETAIIFARCYIHA